MCGLRPFDCLTLLLLAVFSPSGAVSGSMALSRHSWTLLPDIVDDSQSVGVDIIIPTGPVTVATADARTPRTAASNSAAAAAAAAGTLWSFEAFKWPRVAMLDNSRMTERFKLRYVSLVDFSCTTWYTAVKLVFVWANSEGDETPVLPTWGGLGWGGKWTDPSHRYVTT